MDGLERMKTKRQTLTLQRVSEHMEVVDKNGL